MPIMIAPVVVGLLWRYLFDANFGLINHVVSLLGLEPKVWLGTPGLALPAIIITDIWQWTPFMFILFLAGLQSLPSSPVEAPQVDGASTWQIIRLVKLPLLAPVIRARPLFFWSMLDPCGTSGLGLFMMLPLVKFRLIAMSVLAT